MQVCTRRHDLVRYHYCQSHLIGMKVVFSDPSYILRASCVLQHACIMRACFPQTFRLGPCAHLHCADGPPTNKIAAGSHQFLVIMPSILTALRLPLYTIFAIIYLWVLFGASSVAGIFVVVASMVAALCTSIKLKRLHTDKAQIVEARSNVLGAAIRDVRSMKSSTSEAAVEESADSVRASEATLARKCAYLHLSISSLSLITPPTAVLAMFLVWSSLSDDSKSEDGDSLSLASLFSVLALITMLQAPLMGLSEDISSCRKVRISIKK